MLTPDTSALPRSAAPSTPRVALVCVSLASALMISSIGFAQTQPPPPPGAAVPGTPPAGALPPAPQPPPPTTAAPPPGYVPQPGATPPAGYAPPPGYSPPPGYAPPPGYSPPPGYAPPPGYSPPPGYAPPAGYTPPPGYTPPTGYGPPGDYGQAPPGYGPTPPGYQPYYGYGPYYGPPAGPPPPKYQRHNANMMVGGVLLTTGGILGVLIGSAVASTAADQIPIYCNQPGFGVTVCETRADKGQLAGGVIGLVAGVIAIGVGIPMWVIGGKREPIKESKPADPASAPSTSPAPPKTSLELVVGPSSAALRATF